MGQCYPDFAIERIRPRECPHSRLYYLQKIQMPSNKTKLLLELMFLKNFRWLGNGYF
jgi:hypothetical protein